MENKGKSPESEKAKKPDSRLHYLLKILVVLLIVFLTLFLQRNWETFKVAYYAVAVTRAESKEKESKCIDACFQRWADFDYCKYKCR